MPTLESLRRLGSFDVRTPPEGRTTLHTTVYLDGDVITRVFAESVDDPIIESHFAEVARLGKVLAAQLRRVTASLWAAWLVVLVVLVTLGSVVRESWILLAEVIVGVALSAVVDRLGWLRLRIAWLGELAIVAVPIALAIVTWRLGLGEFPLAATLIALGNLLIIALRTYLRWRVARWLTGRAWI